MGTAELLEKPTSTNLFSIIIGIFFLIQGSWGLIDPPPFEVFTTNPTHAVIHILLGIVGVWTGAKKGAYIFCIFLGLVLLVLGLLYFVSYTGQILAGMFNMNFAVAILNIVIGILALMFALADGRRPKPDRRKY